MLQVAGSSGAFSFNDVSCLSNQIISLTILANQIGGEWYEF
jgi:hypothetical protein